MIKINYKEKSFVVEDKAQIDWCRSKNYGVEISGKTHLMNYETLYLIEKKQAKLVSKKKFHMIHTNMQFLNN